MDYPIKLRAGWIEIVTFMLFPGGKTVILQCLKGASSLMQVWA